jgi:hypothetical protein
VLLALLVVVTRVYGFFILVNLGEFFCDWIEAIGFSLNRLC